MTFDEWWKEAEVQGRWIGEDKIDAKANTRVGWHAALRYAVPEELSIEERAVIDAAMRWYRHGDADGMCAEDFSKASADEWRACEALAKRRSMNNGGQS